MRFIPVIKIFCARGNKTEKCWCVTARVGVEQICCRSLGPQRAAFRPLRRPSPWLSLARRGAGLARHPSALPSCAVASAAWFVSDIRSGSLGRRERLGYPRRWREGVQVLSPLPCPCGRDDAGSGARVRTPRARASTVDVEQLPFVSPRHPVTHRTHLPYFPRGAPARSDVGAGTSLAPTSVTRRRTPEQLGADV